MYHNDFRDLVLINPIREGAEHLKIVSGYATHTMASWHITEVSAQGINPIEITLIFGMCPFDGISDSVHNGFINLVNRNGTLEQSNFTCQYVVEGAPVHSKLYVWEKNGTPFRAYMGSANYTQSAFSRQRRELIQECDPVVAMNYFEAVESNSMYCNHAEILDKVVITQAHQILSAEENPAVSVRGLGVNTVTLSLLTNRGSNKGNTGFGSGINWGHRQNGTKRELNQAYISLPAEIARSGFFPLEGNRNGKHNPHFAVLTDDGINLILRVEQQNNKAITTPLNNSLIGEYFRKRIGVANGAYVTRQDLENYGRTDVTFYKLDDEQYFMDFSI